MLTTLSTTPDYVMGLIQQGLAPKKRDLLPGQQLFDSGYVDARLLVTAQSRHQIEVVGPLLRPTRAGKVERQRGMA